MRFILYSLLMASSFHVMALNDMVFETKNEIVFNTTYYNLESDYKKAAMRALITRDWEIVSVADSEVVGKLPYGDYPPVVINFSNPAKVSIRYQQSSDTGSNSYLKNLKRDMLDNLLSCTFIK